jgi:hypothetical protein
MNKELSLSIEHRNFSLTIQEKHYNKLIDMLVENDIHLTKNNKLSSILSLCMKCCIENIDINDAIDTSIQNIKNKVEIK